MAALRGVHPRSPFNPSPNFKNEYRQVQPFHVKNRSSFGITSVYKHKFQPLPFRANEWRPYVSEESVVLHHEGHYKGYLDALNGQLADRDDLARLSLEELVKKSYNHGNPLPCFNNAAQAWNHEFYFWSLSPNSGGGVPQGDLMEFIERDFGSFDNFKEQFQQSAMDLHGSGWTWLSVKVQNPYPDCFYNAPEVFAGRTEDRVKVGRLVIENTKNAICPLVWNNWPVLALDLWEHAYISDFKENKAAHVHNFLQNVVSWDVAQRRFDQVKHFVTMRTPPLPENPTYNAIMSDAQWLLANPRKRYTKLNPEEEERKISRGMLKKKPKGSVVGRGATPNDGDLPELDGSGVGAKVEDSGLE